MRSWLIVALLLAGCGDDGGTPDGAIDTGADSASIDVTPPAAPAPPAPPVLTPCAEGFRTVAIGDGIDACEPWPESGRDDTCAAHEAHFPGEPGCARVGTTCPADGLPEGVDAGALFVSSGATGGDGSRGAPFGTIAEALAVASPGSVVAVGVGVYDEALRYGDGIEIVGACAESTIIRSSAPSSSAGVVTAAPGGALLANVTLGASERPGLWGTTAAARFTLENVIVQSPKWVGVNLESGASLEATGFVVRDVVPGDGGLFGRGLTIESGSSATVTRGAVTGTREFGIVSLGEGSEVTLDHVLVFDSAPRVSDALAGTGLAAADGGAVTGRAVVLEETTDVGAAALRSSRIELSDSVIRDTRFHPVSRDHGRGVDSESGSTIVIRRTLLERNAEFGVLADETGRLELYDTVIRETRPREVDGRFGRGVSIQNGGALVAERLAVLDNLECGIFAARDGASLDVSDLLVARNTGDVMSSAVGRGLMIQETAQAIIRRAVIEDCREVGVFVSSRGSDATFEDLVIRRTGPSNGDNFGRGLLVQAASASVVRAVIEDNHDLGVFIDDAELVAEDLVVGTVLPQACAATTCSTIPGGHGVGVYGDGRLEVRRFRIEAADLCGLHLAEGGLAATLEDGLIADNAIGVCVQNPLQDLAVLNRDTRFTDNGITLDTTMLPVPGVVSEVSE